MILAERIGADIADELIEGQRLADKQLLKNARLAAEFDASGFWDEAGSNTASEWIRHNCHLTDKAAGDLIAVGQRINDMADSVRAMEAGEIGFAHLVVLARTANAVGERFEEKKLLQLARKHSPGKLYYKCQHYRHSLDAKGYNREQVGLMESRRLNLSRAEDGCVLVYGVLDPVGGAAVRTALEPLAQRSGEHDDRRLEQRFADALVELACGGKPAHLQVTTSIETLKGLVGAAGAEMEFALPLSSTAVQRMACDCSVTRVLLDQESLPVDVGRAKRIISGPAMRALKARDGHCRWPGCERPASRCDGTSRRALGKWRAHRSIQSCPALSSASLDGA